MSRYVVSINGHEYSISLQDDQVLIDGQPVDVELLQLNDSGLYSLSRDRETFELHLHNQDSETLEVLAGGQRYVARIETPQRRLRKRPGMEQNDQVTAPMPGLVVEVLVEPGDLVEADQSVVVVESMKMQMQIRTPIAGHVAEIGAQIGQQVDKGTMLVRIEELKGNASELAGLGIED